MGQSQSLSGDVEASQPPRRRNTVNVDVTRAASDANQDDPSLAATGVAAAHPLRCRQRQQHSQSLQSQHVARQQQQLQQQRQRISDSSVSRTSSTPSAGSSSRFSRRHHRQRNQSSSSRFFFGSLRRSNVSSSSGGSTVDDPLSILDATPQQRQARHRQANLPSSPEQRHKKQQQKPATEPIRLLEPTNKNDRQNSHGPSHSLKTKEVRKKSGEKKQVVLEPQLSLKDDEPPSLIAMMADDALLSHSNCMSSSSDEDEGEEVTSSSQAALDDDRSAEVAAVQTRPSEKSNSSFRPNSSSDTRPSLVLPAAPISPSQRVLVRNNGTVGRTPSPFSDPRAAAAGNSQTLHPKAKTNNNNNLRDILVSDQQRLSNHESMVSSNRSSSTSTTVTAEVHNRSSSKIPVADDVPAPNNDHEEEKVEEAPLPPPPPPLSPPFPSAADSLVSEAVAVPPLPPGLSPSAQTEYAVKTHFPALMRTLSGSQSSLVYYNRRGSLGSTLSSEYDDEETARSLLFQSQEFVDFFPRISRNHEWMGRSIESLILGHLSHAPVLALEDGADDDMSTEHYVAFRRRSTASTFGGGRMELSRRRSSQGSSFPVGGRRGSLSLTGNVHGGTLANYYSHRRRQQQYDFVDRSFSERIGRRGSAASTAFRRRSTAGGSITTTGSNDAAEGQDHTNNHGPNVLLSIIARESTGRTSFARGIPVSQSLRSMGGTPLFGLLDQPAAGMATEVAFLEAAIQTGDWTETHSIISRLAPRLTGDPMVGPEQRSGIEDANLPPTAHKTYAGGGRLGLERDAFCMAGGVQVLIRIFREKSFVGEEMSGSYDARDLSHEIVAIRLASCWNEALISLRELVYAIPSLVEDGTILDHGKFLPFLFTLLAHDSCFEAAAALIEEILSLLSQAHQQVVQHDESMEGLTPHRAPGRQVPVNTFYLGNVPGDLYKLWRGFSCRQLAHFCRILALLVFEPEDRQVLDTPPVLKSLGLLQLRRNRSVRAGIDSTVDLNQSILLGDEVLIGRLLKLLLVMNYAPSIRRFSPYHIMAHNPFIVDTMLLLGFSELENWEEISRQDNLARDLLRPRGNRGRATVISRLGSIASWLEDLEDTLGEEREPANQILRIMTAAQQAGLVVGSRRNRRWFRPPSETDWPNDDGPLAEAENRGGGANGASAQGLSSVAGMLTDEVLVRRLYQNISQDAGDFPDFMSGRGDGRPPFRHPIQTPPDAANNLQFNAMLLGPYQVEILFVLCTLLGGRRKLDAQDQVERLGLIPILEEMYERLPWYTSDNGDEDGDEGDNRRLLREEQQQHNRIHGPGCECTPESALCVQYLRLLHNYCDRDCDNYGGRRLLLSDDERAFLFDGEGGNDAAEPRPGLLSKIIRAFMSESDESPYRFWLASCIESYLRGSSPREQVFVAKSGLLGHLVQDVSSERLHCAGSLQTSFDLLGELGKGNPDVFRLLVSELDEESFRKLMGVVAKNLVDSNVFIRSLLLSLERLSAEHRMLSLFQNATTERSQPPDWTSARGTQSRSYLSHSWWDTHPISLFSEMGDDSDNGHTSEEEEEHRQSDWFPSLALVQQNAATGYRPPSSQVGPEQLIAWDSWLFAPSGESSLSVERLGWFLAANQTRLLHDLLGVVDLRNINHENICCLNTAVVIVIFANRRQQLSLLLQELRQTNSAEREEFNHRALLPSATDDEFDSSNSEGQIGDRGDVLRNFREVLWFWREYYTHRGRDRLSLEFSSHLRYQEWDHVVSLLTADDGSQFALVSGPLRLPRSPYQRSARVVENPLRGL